MKICFFHSSMQAGGIERTIALLANMYAQNGDNISIITMSDEESFYSLSPDIVYYGQNLESNSLGIIQAVVSNAKRIGYVRRYLKKLNPDIIMTFSANTELIGYFAKCRETKLIGAERANPFKRSAGFWSRNTGIIATLCDGFLFQTMGAASYFPKKVKEKALIVQNGLDSAICKKYDKEWNKRKGICSVGRMDVDKGFDDIIRAFSIVAKSVPHIVLDLYGDGPMKKELEELAVTLGVANQVIFHGRCNAMMEEYSSHKIFLMMSKSEGFPNVLLEAMACGCLCISTNCDFGPSELIEDRKNGILVDIGDYQSAACAIIHYLKHDTEAKMISESAKTVRETNNIETIGIEIHDYLLKILID